MIFTKRRRITVILLCFTSLVSLTLGMLIGFALAQTENMKYLNGDLTPIKSALPTQIFDRNGELITEFFNEEKRKIMPLNEVPDHLLFAIITREDRRFYEHFGFDIIRLAKAIFDIFRGKYSGGASTISQQVAGNRYLDRTEKTLRRKILELWYSAQLERNYTKQEILEFYINEVPFGGGTNGVETASQFYFQKSVKEITIAESVILANVIASHRSYSPFKNPNKTQKRQKEILRQMVELDYISQQEADESFYQYWQNFKGTRSSADNAWRNRNDKAPWFSWYLRDELEKLHLNSDDIWKGGLKIYTTLDLSFQRKANKAVSNGLKYANRIFNENVQERIRAAKNHFSPIIDLLSLGFNIKDLRTASSVEKTQATKYYQKYLNPLIDMLSVSFDHKDLKKITNTGFIIEEERSRKNEIEGALVSIDSHTGHILAMVGGSNLDSRTNWFNRAVDGRIQPGSAYKPLYYSAAVESKLFNAASLIIDRPMAFHTDEGRLYIPKNFKGRWKGYVLLHEALAHSMNVPSIQVMEKLGLDKGIDHTGKMLGIMDPLEREKVFPRSLALGLGILQVSPLQLARAYAIFPNSGKEVTPLAIRFIKDRYGKIILEPEKKLLTNQKQRGSALQIISPQTAYVMTSMLQRTVKEGTLAGTEHWSGGWEDRPIAGKTGTTDNWAAAWTCGFTNQVTTAMWFGFDEGNNSLGTNMTGATLTGRFWAPYMKSIHEFQPKEDFSKPATGIHNVTVCSLSGDLPSQEGYCSDHTYEEVFIEGTQPQEYCSLHKKLIDAKNLFNQNLQHRLDLILKDPHVSENPFRLFTDEAKKIKYLESMGWLPEEPEPEKTSQSEED